MNAKTIRWLIINTSAIAFQPLSAHELAYRISDNNVPAQVVLDPYFLAHNVDTHIFETLKVELTPEQTADAIKFIAATVSLTSPNGILVKNYRGKKDLRINFKLLKLKDDLALIIGTNYDARTDSLQDTPSNQQFAVLFYVIINRTVYYKDMYSPEREKELKASKNLVSLADFYLMDDRTENDSRVPDLLNQISADPEFAPIQKFIAMLTKGQVALIKYDFKAAEGILMDGKKEFEALKGEDRAIGSMVLKLFTRESDIMKLMLKK